MDYKKIIEENKSFAGLVGGGVVVLLLLILWPGKDTDTKIGKSNDKQSLFEKYSVQGIEPLSIEDAEADAFDMGSSRYAALESEELSFEVPKIDVASIERENKMEELREQEIKNRMRALEIAEREAAIRASSSRMRQRTASPAKKTPETPSDPFANLYFSASESKGNAYRQSNNNGSAEEVYVQAEIATTTKVRNNGTVSILLNEPLTINKQITLSRGTLLNAVASANKDRMQLVIRSIVQANKIHPVNILVFDENLLKGIPLDHPLLAEDVQALTSDVTDMGIEHIPVVAGPIKSLAQSIKKKTINKKILSSAIKGTKLYLQVNP